MSVFKFNKKNAEQAKKIIAQYPPDRKKSAIMGLLDIAQRQSGGWIPKEALEYVASMLDIHPAKAYEVASFYSMFNLKPVGKYHIQICGTTPCMLRGSEEIKNICIKKLGIKMGETDQNKKFTLTEVECLGACIKAPVVQINDEYHEELTEDEITKILTKLAK